MTTIRIDTLRNRLAGTRELLAMIAEELEDLHVLAYERATSASEAKVSGGSRDYALDTHGDPDARKAYRHLGDIIDGTCTNLNEAAQNALNLLREGRTPGRGQRHLRLVELGEAIAAQSRRTKRGDYTPVRRGPQPDQLHAMDQMRKERDAALGKIEQANKQRDRAIRELSECRNRRSSTS